MTAPALVRRLRADQLDITIHEGRKRQVRRMCDAVGHPVKEIERIAFGPLRLGTLPRGQARRLTPRGDAAPARTDMMPPAMRLFALRGATSIDRDEAPLILDGTTVLLQEILERNALTPTDVVSCIFTCTQDLDAEYPAVAARAMGFNTRPAAVHAGDGGARVVVAGRCALLMHFYADEAHEVRHVYHGEARRLRLDIAGAQ